MKKILLIFLLVPFLSYSQKKSGCCVHSSTENFAMLSSDKDFVGAHLDPLPFNYSEMTGKMIQLPVPGQKAGNAYEIKAKLPTDKWLFIFHEWWGLNDYIKREADKFAQDLPAVNIMAIDLYDGTIATNKDAAQEAMSKMIDDRSITLIEAAMQHAGPNSKIGTLGWCLGGGWSLKASLLAKESAIACVIYYGMPETEEEKLKELHADVLGIFAIKDEWITPEIVEKFKSSMEGQGKKIIVKNFPASHAFANPSNPYYNAEYANEAYKISIQFLRDKLK